MNADKLSLKDRLKSFKASVDIIVYMCAAAFFAVFYLTDTPYETGFFLYLGLQAVVCGGITAAAMLKSPLGYDRILTRSVYCWACTAGMYIIAKLINNVARYIDTGSFANPLNFRTLLSMMGVCVWILAAMLIVRLFAKPDKDADDKARFVKTFRQVGLVFIIACFITLIDGFIFIRRIDLFGARDFRIIPFSTIIAMWNSGMSPFKLFCQYAGNLLLFFPFGFFAKSRGLDKINKKRSKAAFYLFPVALTLTIELSQLILNTGCCDIDDVILNIAGYYIGVLAVTAINRMRKVITRGKETDMFSL